MSDDVLQIISAIFLLIVVIMILRKTKEDYHSNWAKLLPGFKFSTQQFYELVKNEMLSHEISGLTFKEKKLKTGNLFSSRRLYLRIHWRDYHFDLCFAPFGDGCFVSWWLIYEKSFGEIILSKFLGELIASAFYRKTFYKIDTASMFMTYSNNSVLKVIDEIIKETGIRLSEDDRKPTIKEIYRR